MMIICPVCGKETEGGFEFCMNCRSEIGGVNASPAAPAETVGQVTIPDHSNYPNTYAAPDPNVVRAQTKKKGPGAGRKVAAFFLGIFLFFSGLVTLSLYCVKETVSVENLTEALTDASAIASIEVGDLTGREEDNGKTISGYILEQLPEDQKEKFPELTEDSINRFLSDEAAREVIAIPLGDLIDYLAGDKDEFSIDSAQVVQVLEENSDAIEKYTGKKLDTEDLNSIRDEINEFNEKELTEKPGAENAGITAGMKGLKFFMSEGMFHVAAGVTAFFALMIIVVFGRYFDSALIRIGLTGTFVGSLVYFGIKVGRFAIDRTMAGKVGAVVLDMLDKAVFDQFRSTGFVVLCASAGTIAAGVFIKVIRNAVTT